jgi:3D (Asp-Asp-Asp) domain-containing protein
LATLTTNNTRLHNYYLGVISFLLSFTLVIAGIYIYYRYLSFISPDTLPAVTTTSHFTSITPKENTLPSTDIPIIIAPKIDNYNVIKEEKPPDAMPSLGKIVRMEATAYCLKSITRSGVKSNYGIIAADPKWLPIGSIVRLEAQEYSGLYSVLDTGSKIKGRKIDIYLDNYEEAISFGRRRVRLEVLRYGWHPQASSPTF